MKHVAPDLFETCRPLPATPARTPWWRRRLSAWWRCVGWDQNALPETLRPDVERDHPSARPIRGRAGWERRL